MLRCIVKTYNYPCELAHHEKVGGVVHLVKAYKGLVQTTDERWLDLELKNAIEAYAQGHRGTPGPGAFRQIRERAVTRRACS